MSADILVVGAGMAGLTVAAHLLDRGFSVAVLEQAPALRVAGAGITLHPNALDHLGHLGPELAAAAAGIERQVVIDRSGATTVVEWAKVWPGRGLPLAIHRRRLADLMLGRLPPGVVRWATRPVCLTQEADGVTVVLDNGERDRYQLVLGADGVHSWVRGFVDTEASAKYLGQMYWRTTVVAAAPFDLPDWRVWRAGGHFFGVMPIGGGRSHVFLQAASKEPWRGPPERVRADMHFLAEQMGPEVAGFVKAISLDDDLQVRPALSLQVSRWRSERVAVLGDAAHAMSPAATQGGALAIEDAEVLADEVHRHGPGPLALAAFEARRAPRVTAFGRRVQHHVTLMAAVQTSRLAPPGQISGHDPAGWFRQLYRPLFDAP